MSSWAQWTAKTIMLTAGFAAAGTGVTTAAFAQTAGNLPGPGLLTSGAGSVAGGNQASIPITLPVNVCGNAAAVLGLATAGCQGGASAIGSGVGVPSMTTSGTGSVGGGNQVSVPVKAPVDVCGNAVGNAKAHCAGGALAPKGGGKTSMVTNGSGSVLGGNQVSVPVTAPVDVCGNSVAVLGLAGAACQGGSTVGNVISGVRHATGQCGCLKGSDANTPLLTAYTSRTAPPAKAALASFERPATATPSDPFNPAPQAPGAVKSATGKAALGTLPLVAGLPSLAGLSSLPSLAATPGAGMLLPQSSLSASNGAGMSTTSFFILAGGVLLAGISALKLSGRRARAIRGGKAAA